MTGIELYSTTAENNNSAPPNGWPEGQAPSTVNDCARQMMSAVRTWYEDAEWIKWGDTTVYVSGTSFKITGSDVTARYNVGRRVRAVGSSTGTIYGKIVTSAFSTDTTVTLVWDSGSLSNETLTISIASAKGAVTGRSIDIDAAMFHGGDIASATTVVLDSATGDLVDVTGTTTITTITLAEGRERTVRFTGILILTNGASLVLPGAANITTAAGDYAIFRGYAAGVVRCVIYSKASGIAIAGSTTFTDSTFTVGDDGDATKKLAFQCSGITTGTTRTITIPDVSGTLALTSTAGPIPTNSATVGQFLPLGNVISTNVVLPAGGTWAYFACLVSTTGTFDSNVVAGVAAGGATVLTVSAGKNATGFCWRIT